jgi:hypothetical protein
MDVALNGNWALGLVSNKSYFDILAIYCIQE